jgi:hypothetical protein
MSKNNYNTTDLNRLIPGEDIYGDQKSNKEEIEQRKKERSFEKERLNPKGHHKKEHESEEVIRKESLWQKILSRSRKER